MSIKDFAKKIKPDENRWQKHVLLPVFIILTAFLSFGLGRLSASEEQQDIPVVIKQSPEKIFTRMTENTSLESEKEVTASKGEKKNFVASKNGTRYYLPWCGGADRINEENKIWFTTEEEAREYGLTPAKNCTGI